MLNIKNALIPTVVLTALMSATAIAAVNNIKDMKNGSQIHLTGTVDSVNNAREFTLRDNSGTIDIDIISNDSVVLKKGDSVTVSGTVDKDLFDTDIKATQVAVNKSMGKAIGDAIEGNTSLSLEGATSYKINSLPAQGLVKVSGTVSKVDSEKEFTLNDGTGKINIDIQSSETAAIMKGSEVTVIGYVDKGLLGTDINAHKVLVVADATPMANTQ